MRPGETHGSDALVPETVDVLVVVVTYNSADALPGLLRSIHAGVGPDVSYRLVVADNCSTDDTIAVARREAPNAHILELGSNGGYAAAFNAAVASSPAFASVLLLNPDVRLDPDAVPRLLDAQRTHGAGITVPGLIDELGARAHSLRREPSLSRTLCEAVLGGTRAGLLGLGEVVRHGPSYEHAGQWAWASGCAMLIDRACLDAVGPWNEELFLYGEEAEFALRARDRGWSLWYTPAAQAVHLGGESHQSPRLWTILVINKLRLFRLRHHRVSSAAYWVVLILHEALRSTKSTHRAALAALVRPSRRPIEVR